MGQVGSLRIRNEVWCGGHGSCQGIWPLSHGDGGWPVTGQRDHQQGISESIKPIRGQHSPQVWFLTIAWSRSGSQSGKPWTQRKDRGLPQSPWPVSVVMTQPPGPPPWDLMAMHPGNCSSRGSVLVQGARLHPYWQLLGYQGRPAGWGTHWLPRWPLGQDSLPSSHFPGFKSWWGLWCSAGVRCAC